MPFALFFLYFVTAILMELLEQVFSRQAKGKWCYQWGFNSSIILQLLVGFAHRWKWWKDGVERNTTYTDDWINSPEIRQMLIFMLNMGSCHFLLKLKPLCVKIWLKQMRYMSTFQTWVFWVFFFLEKNKIITDRILVLPGIIITSGHLTFVVY